MGKGTKKRKNVYSEHEITPLLEVDIQIQKSKILIIELSVY